MELYELGKNKKIYSLLYYNRYFKFINYFINYQNNIHENFEIHHILPKSLFPKYSKDEINLIKLPYRVHYLLHFMLAKIYKSSMIYAFNSMCNRNLNKYSKINSVLYSNNRKSFSEIHKKWHSEINENGISNSKLIGQKTKETKILNNSYQEICKKSAATMMNTFLENGLSIAQNRALNTANKIKENNSLKGEKSSNAKYIQVFDTNNNLRYEFISGFFEKAKELNLPVRALKTSYLNNGAPIYKSKCGETVAKRLHFEKFIGWYALIICRARDVNKTPLETL